MSGQKNNNSALFQKLQQLKATGTISKNNGYDSLVDTTLSSHISCLEDTMRVVVPMQRSLIDHLTLVQKARTLLKEYLNMKSFILNIYTPSVVEKIGIYDIEEKNKMIKKIAMEMEENIKNLTDLATRISNTKGSRLDKELAYNELKSLTNDLSYRLESYKRHYQSYIVTHAETTQILYQNKQYEEA